MMAASLWPGEALAVACLLLVLCGPAAASPLLDIDSLVDDAVVVSTGLAPIAGALLPQISPLTGPLNALLQQAVLRNDVTQFSSDIVTLGRALLGVLVKAALPVEPPIRPDTEACSRGYRTEYHNVTTEDGYILGLFRVTNPNCTCLRSVAVVAPAFLVNAASFMFVGKKSLVYQLADLGHDVWIVSFRGSLFARGHTSLKDTSQAFWDFYPYHFGVFDLAAQLDFISSRTGSTTMRYVGSDQANLALLFMNHVHGERYQRLLAGAYIIGPIGYMGRCSSAAIAAAGVGRDILGAAGAVALHGEFLVMDPTIHGALYTLCRLSPDTIYFYINLVLGATRQIDKTHLIDLFRNALDSAPISYGAYFGQQFGKGNYLAYFDYGEEENLRRYNSSTPIPVRLDRTTVKCSYFGLPDSTFAVAEDSLDTFKALAPEAQSHFELVPGHNAYSVLVPLDPDNIYGPLIERYEYDLGHQCKS